MSESKIAVVVGASSGIGAEVARGFAGRGYKVALVARREAQLTSLAEEINRIAGRELAKIYVSDVVEYDKIPALLRQIIGDLGGVDVVVYSSGVSPSVGPNEYSFEKDRQVIEVNVLGAMAWLNLAAERFEKTKAGTIIGISSVAGDRGRRGVPAYNTSKAALDTYLEALRNRLGRYGVHVLTIKPGFVYTDLIAGLKLPPFPKPISAKAAADEILKAYDEGAQTVYVPKIWGVIGAVIKMVPSPIMQKLNI